ncbi:MAG: arginine--tRNA ligase, partial [Thermoanaerobaculia bacterium]
MWTELKAQLAGEIARAIRETFGVDHQPVLEVPPRRELGDLASPAAMQLARTLKRNPRAIAEELAAAIRRTPPLNIVKDIKIQGAGYLNFYLDRPVLAARLLEAPLLQALVPGGARAGKIIIEHTNINPNKAAHIGHLRNAVLGDVLGRALKSLGYPVEIQNYIDDTGVQVADVAIGFRELEHKTLDQVRAIADAGKFDYYCWDLYARVTEWYEGDAARLKIRTRALHDI